MITSYVALGRARGDLGAGLRAAVPTATGHLRELLRGGAAADSLNTIGWAIVRVPGLSPADYELARRACREGLLQYDTLRTPLPLPLCNLLNTMALAEVRCSAWEEAITAADRSIETRVENELPEEALDHAFLAMALMGKGQEAKARNELEYGRVLLDGSASGSTDTGDAVDATPVVSETALLFAEAERMVAGDQERGTVR